MTSKLLAEPNVFQLVDALIDDLMALSDEELLCEVRQDGVDPDRLAGEVRERLQAGIIRENKMRLVKARTELDGVRAARASTNVASLSLSRKQQILSQFAAGDGRLRERLTMAARKGEGASEREINDILKDLVDLGAIDDEGNPR